MKEIKKYEAPVIKAVSFKVEVGAILSGGGSTSAINFGGTFATGGVTNDANTNHSGLGEYGYGSLFDRNN